MEGNNTFAVLPQEDPSPGKLANIALHPVPAPWKATLHLGAWRVLNRYEEELAVMRGPDEYRESNARLMAVAPELARVLRLAVNALSTLLVNLADAEDDRPPEGGAFYGDVVQAARSRDAAVRAGILPDNYMSDGVARLLERIKQQDRDQGLERQRSARGEQASSSR